MSDKTSTLLSDVSIEGDIIEKDRIVIDAKVNGDIKSEDITTHSNSNIKGNIKLPDNSIKEFKSGVTGFDIAESIGQGLLKASIAVKVDGELKDLHYGIDNDSYIEIVTKKTGARIASIKFSFAMGKSW